MWGSDPEDEDFMDADNDNVDIPEDEAPVPAAPQTVANLPMREAIVADQDEDGHVLCPVCGEEQFGQQVIQLPCEHIFCPTCTLRWLLETSSLCPLCRQSVE